ncbi:hypothetical protein Hanom_Chr09g00809431 [Helianthus anomalus]
MFRNCWKMDTLFCELKEMVRFGALELRECEIVTVVVRRRHRGDAAEWCGEVSGWSPGKKGEDGKGDDCGGEESGGCGGSRWC